MSGLRIDVPHPARMYDYYLGGKDSFPADRAAAGRVVALFPQVRATARANRRFLGRAVRYAARQGIHQFLDIGTGIPTADNTHEVAQAVTADARIVYVDNDPIVLSHARALLRGTPEGRTAYVDADFRDPAAILGSAQVKELLDLSRPVALMVVSLLHFVSDEDRPAEVLKELTSALAPGSALILSHATDEFTPPEVAANVLRTYTAAGLSLTSRTHAELLHFFDGLELVDPGLVPVHEWRTEDQADRALTSGEVAGYAGIGVKRS
ncbi:SAM-dependent methyltransferase [Streptacidiphilus sp. N1-12]|uniref:SAM-dependent methyltransferase n=2 Tax=Streptacidiphilus alkalitolerans TaxID=3342712 RepID=A0ABV6WT96_9ACTN